VVSILAQKWLVSKKSFRTVFAPDCLRQDRLIGKTTGPSIVDIGVNQSRRGMNLRRLEIEEQVFFVVGCVSFGGLRSFKVKGR